MTADLSAATHGWAAPGWEAVRGAFAANFANHGEVGAAVAVYHRGRPVVDLWGGMADAGASRAWEEDTACLVFSSTKGVTAVCANRLAEQGVLDLDAPVATYWPEFAAAGKGEIPVRWVLSHRAGLAAVEGHLTLDEVLAWDPVVAAIAAQAPNWPPGSAHGYHARSFGWIVGEVVRRVTGQSLGGYFAAEVAGPLGLDFWIGLPAAEEPRVARLYPPLRHPDPAVQELIDAFMSGDSLLARVMSGPSDRFAYNDMWNTRALHACELPSSNGIGTARALARMYAATIAEIDGVRLLGAETLAAAARVQSEGTDAVLGMPTRFGTGFALPPMLGTGMGPGAVGHPGAGGSLGFVDPDAELAFGYVMNQMQLGVTGDARAAELVAAVYSCL